MDSATGNRKLAYVEKSEPTFEQKVQLKPVLVNDLVFIFSALLIGISGSAHCALMCGGFAGVLHRSVKGESHLHAGSMMFLYHVGRLFSYALTGAVFAYLGFTLMRAIGEHRAHSLMQLFAGGFLILIGLNLGQWWNGLGVVEKFGQYFWSALKPLTRLVFPARHHYQALLGGMLWGWLPCGFVYSVLVLSMGASEPFLGALAMLAFGIGTVPMLVFAGAMGSALLSNAESHLVVKRIVSVVIILAGAWMFTGLPLPFPGHGHH